jgi:hypothetical protein
MKLGDARQAYEGLSAKASDIVRQISLAGVGVIWVFKSGTTSFSLDPLLLKAAFCIFLALALDFLQYVLGTTIWFVYYRQKENQGTKDDSEFLAPKQINWPTWTLFYLKSTLMLIAYGRYILPFLTSRLHS